MFLDLQVEAIARAAFADGRATGEVALAGADGPRIVVHAHRAPGGGIWLILEDVSELRRLQRIRTEFIDNLSHELRTPLTTVSLLTETLARDAAAAGKGVPPRMRDRIASIEVETGHLVQMVNELLDLSRIESGRALGAMDPLDLGEVAQDATDRLRLFAERQGVDPAVVIPEPVPTVRGDEARLQQVLVNLLHNAVKFSPDGGAVTVTVAERAARRGRVGRRPWRRHPSGGAGAHLRALLQGRPGARPRRERRDRSRPGHRPPHRRAARRPDPGRIDRRSRQHVLVRDDPDRPPAELRSPMDRLHVATLNIRNLADRWFERLPLLLADMAALQPDLLGLQEVVYPMQQDRLLGAAGEGRYGVVRGWAGRPEYGNSLLVREPLAATEADRLELGLNRSAHRAIVALPGGSSVLVVVTHLHHLGAGRGAARRADRRDPALAGRRSRRGRDDPGGRLQRRSRGTGPGRLRARGVPVGLRRGQRG